MSVQTTYSHATPRGVAGSLFDIAPYSIDSRLNGEAETGRLLYGMGVVQGSSPGSDVKIPVDDSEIEKFEGIALNGFSTQQNMAGIVEILPLQTVGVLRYGKAWARIKSGISPAYGDELYLIISGDNAGLFTNSSASNTITVKGRFIGAKGTGDVAPVEIFNQLQETMKVEVGIGG